MKAADLDVRRKRDGLHGVVHGAARIHHLDRLALNIRNRIVHRGKVGADACPPANGLTVAGDNQFRAKFTHQFNRA